MKLLGALENGDGNFCKDFLLENNLGPHVPELPPSGPLFIYVCDSLRMCTCSCRITEDDGTRTNWVGVLEELYQGISALSNKNNQVSVHRISEIECQKIQAQGMQTFPFSTFNTTKNTFNQPGGQATQSEIHKAKLLIETVISGGLGPAKMFDQSKHDSALAVDYTAECGYTA